MKEHLTYDDVLLQPQYSEIESKHDVDISPPIPGMELPIFSAPMETVTGLESALALYEVGGRGVIHRYNSIDEQVAICRDMFSLTPVQANHPVYAAVGVTGDSRKRVQALYNAGVRAFCVDVAHGHHVLVKKMLEDMRDAYKSKITIMAGNVATLEAFNDLADWGADSIRCGIGGGSICSTRIQTGHGVPSLQTVLDCGRSNREAILIADGGIRKSGDIVKALAAGADCVMLGSLLAGTTEAPGDLVHGKKVYRGMASKEAQLDWRGKVSSIEGIQTMVQWKGSVKEVLDELCTGIRSGFSYSGAKDLKEFQSKARFLKQSKASIFESGTHILNK